MYRVEVGVSFTPCPPPPLPGAALTLALSLLQVRRADSTSWLLVPLSASGATAIGLVYPYVVGGKGDAPDGSQVLRCVAVFVGIYQASTVSSHYQIFAVQFFPIPKLNSDLSHEPVLDQCSED